MFFVYTLGLTTLSIPLSLIIRKEIESTPHEPIINLFFKKPSSLLPRRFGVLFAVLLFVELYYMIFFSWIRHGVNLLVELLTFSRIKPSR
jgi:hypothetical protein